MTEEFIGVDFWTALFVLLNTLAIFFVGKKYLFVPVKKMIDSRQQEIDDMYQQADSAKEQAMAMQAEYQKKLADAQTTGERIVREAVERGRSREEEIIRRANQDAGAMMEKAAADAAREKKKVLNEAKDEISVIAVDIAGKLVGRQISADDQNGLIDSFINELGDQA